MANPFDIATTAAMGAIRGMAGATIAYHRGDDSVTVTAVQGQTNFRTSDTYGASILVRSFDWLIDAADLVIDDATITPEVGDEIQHTGGDGIARRYEVARPVTGEPHWRFSDRDHQRIRIHTNFVGVVA